MIQVSMKEWTVLTFIRHYWQEHGYAPSCLDIATACSISSKYAAYRLVKKMAKRGVVRFGKFKSARTLMLCKVEVGVAL